MKSTSVTTKTPFPINRFGFFTIAFVILISILVSCIKMPVPDPDAAGKYDGVYDFSIVVSSPTGNQTIVLPSGFFIIRNGVISSSDNTLSGSVLDNFGNVEFTGPCPINSGSATYTGILNALSGPKFGQGNYTCQIGGITRTWRAYNGK